MEYVYLDFKFDWLSFWLRLMFTEVYLTCWCELHCYFTSSELDLALLDYIQVTWLVVTWYWPIMILLSSGHMTGNDLSGVPLILFLLNQISVQVRLKFITCLICLILRVSKLIVILFISISVSQPSDKEILPISFESTWLRKILLYKFPTAWSGQYPVT